MTTTPVTIGEASTRTGLSVDALRYYEDEGLIGPLDRDGANHRVFSENDLAWIAVITCMRDAGLGIADLRTFCDLLHRRRATADPVAFLRDRRAALAARAAVLDRAIAVLDDKIAHFSRVDAASTVPGADPTDT
ncbi:MerR family transcriptional regulator [Cellulomonas taurus]|uniref:MerR family transcriptional regulator n=1 Tax=Cellulomonas taurus TaxID=2729175 RepID=UPI00145F832D|nr:MerR family transcriptional regulator [Cellulomonas taurus]